MVSPNSLTVALANILSTLATGTRVRTTHWRWCMEFYKSRTFRLLWYFHSLCNKLNLPWHFYRFWESLFFVSSSDFSISQNNWLASSCSCVTSIGIHFRGLKCSYHHRDVGICWLYAPLYRVSAGDRLPRDCDAPDHVSLMTYYLALIRVLSVVAPSLGSLSIVYAMEHSPRWCCLNSFGLVRFASRVQTLIGVLIVCLFTIIGFMWIMWLATGASAGDLVRNEFPDGCFDLLYGQHLSTSTISSFGSHRLIFVFQWTRRPFVMNLSAS
jgi:hypothetical protein